MNKQLVKKEDLKSYEGEEGSQTKPVMKRLSNQNVIKEAAAFSQPTPFHLKQLMNAYVVFAIIVL